MDTEILARIQFAFTIAFHYIYPPLSIGIGLIMVIFEGLYLKTGNKQYEILTRFWLKIFAITFGIGVATGIMVTTMVGAETDMAMEVIVVMDTIELNKPIIIR